MYVTLEAALLDQPNAYILRELGYPFSGDTKGEYIALCDSNGHELMQLDGATLDCLVVR
jgi:hypothetical protein